jgi:hypothetical protein
MTNLRVNGTNPFNSVPSTSAPSSRPIIPNDSPRRNEPVRDSFNSDSRRGNIPGNSVQFGTNPFDHSSKPDFSQPVIPNDRPYGNDPFNKPHYPSQPKPSQPWGHDPFDKPNYPVMPKPPVMPHDPFGHDPFGHDPFGHDPFDSDPFNHDPFNSGDWEVRNAYDRLISAGSSRSEASRNLELIRNARRSGETLSEVTDSFVQLLRAEGGNSYTSSARTSFEMIQNSLRRGESRANATDTYTRLLSAENDNTSDARSNYRLIDSLMRPYDSRWSDTERFLRIQRQEGGSFYTNSAQREYRRQKDW